MLALSVRAPWWFAIFFMGKDIENREWLTNYRGRVLIHASKWWNEDQVQNDLGEALYVMEQNSSKLTTRPELDLPAMRACGGCIVGSVEIVDCVQSSRSPWLFGTHGLQLANPIAFAQPIPCTGSRKFFEVPEAVACRAEMQIERAG